MASSQPYTVACEGGLIRSTNSLALLKTPGFATKLKNFEVGTEGGYRRVSGYTRFGEDSATNPNGTSKILGLKVYADGVIACSGDGIFFSQDGTSWIQINRTGVSSSGDNYTTFLSRSLKARTDQGQCSFDIFEGASDYGDVLIVDGANKPFRFRMEGTGVLTSRTFIAEEITVTGTVAPKLGTIHDKHFVVAGAADNKNVIYYSGVNDVTNFSAATAGNISLEDAVVGIKSFRNELFIFGKESIQKLVNINDSSNIAVVPVTDNVGCLDGQSIQEIAGDLIFLAPDGFRTVAGTSRIGDIELSSISKQIQPLVQKISEDINNLTISSVVIGDRSQYRLFYVKEGSDTVANSKGIIGTLRPGSTSNPNAGFQWSETLGIQAPAITAGFNKDGLEQYFHGDLSGKVFKHDEGNSFDGANVIAEYQTPDIDYGDLGTLKTLHFIKMSFGPEGEVTPVLRVRYNYDDPNHPQPADYTLDRIPPPSLFGDAKFGAGAVFGASEKPLIRQQLQGSGHSNMFRIRSDDTRSPYTINGFYVDYVPSGRR
jgi:hypothetical protein